MDSRMNDLILNSLRLGIENSFIDASVISSDKHRSELIYNDYKTGRKILSTLINELNECDEFLFSVAFITMSGITPFLQILKELEKKGIKGKIITTNYLEFSEPKALERLINFSNIKVKLYNTVDAKQGFHTKGYLFRKGAVWRSIVGSANMTQSALTINKEWSSSIISTESSQYTRMILDEFGSLWNDENSIKCEDIIEDYKIRYALLKSKREKIRDLVISDGINSLETLNPNSMQKEFIANLKNLKSKGERKALLISATGTGKTYASAFALKEFKPNRVLFLVQ